MKVQMGVSKPIRKSVALVLVKEDDPSKVLLVRRPQDDEEFPGMWGLPATLLRNGETCEEVARRIGVEKLGVEVRVGGLISSGKQERCGYILEMDLYDARLDGSVVSLPVSPTAGRDVTLYTSWRWGDPAELNDSARQGSLCSQLLLYPAGPV